MIGKNKDTEFDIENYEAFYENHNFVETNAADAQNVHEIVPRFGWAFDHISELSPKNLLDLGTLDGSFPITIAKHFGIPTVGVDLTKDGVALARQRAKEAGVDATFYQGTVEDWLEKFAEEGRKFDVVTFFELIEHVKDVPRLLKLVDKVLSPGGSVLLSTPAFEDPIYGKDDEKNKCHIRLYTAEPEDYEEANKYGNVRKATSIRKEIGEKRLKEVNYFSHLLNVWYQ